MIAFRTYEPLNLLSPTIISPTIIIQPVLLPRGVDFKELNPCYLVVAKSPQGVIKPQQQEKEK